MKDPAALLYIDTWLSSTAEMDADCRGWYINLILHQYDKKGLPSDLEKLAQLAVVKFSEFERFKQVFEEVLKHKFTLCDDGRLRNQKADDVIKGRDMFKEKRSKSGNIGVVIKAAKQVGYTDEAIELLKSDLYSEKVDVEKAKDKQMLKHLLKLYVNVIEDEDNSKNPSIKKGVFFQNEELNDIFTRWIKMCGEKGKPFPRSQIEALQMKLNSQSDEKSIAQVKQSLEKGWLNLRVVEDSENKVSAQDAEEMDIAIIKHARNVRANNNGTNVTEDNRMRRISEE